MGKVLQLEIATPEKLVFSGEVEYVTVPGGLGEFTVLPGHTPLLSTVHPGVLRFSGPEGERSYAVGWGYAEVRPYKVLILVEFAQTKEEIDAAQLEEELKDASSKAYDFSLSEEERKSYLKQLERLKARKKLVSA